MTTATFNGTREQQKQISRQPFPAERLIEFCETKQLAKRLACDMGDALLEADRATSRGESDDTAFELMFWDGTLFLDTDEMFDLGIDADSLIDFGSVSAYDEKLDATFWLCSTRRRKFVAVRYEYKEDEYAVSAWWLSSK